MDRRCQFSVEHHKVVNVAFTVALNRAWYDISMSRGYVVSCLKIVIFCETLGR